MISGSEFSRLPQVDFATLAEQQSVKPITDFEQLLGDFWPDDEEEDFDAVLGDWRDED